MCHCFVELGTELALVKNLSDEEVLSASCSRQPFFNNLIETSGVNKVVCGTCELFLLFLSVLNHFISEKACSIFLKWKAITSFQNTLLL